MGILEELEKYSNSIPNVLYHATYNYNVANIMKNGLKPNMPKVYSDSKNYVYLAISPEVAYSYAEVGEPEDDDIDVEDIVVFEINTRMLDTNKISSDENVLDDESTVKYDGIIPPNAITIIDGDF